MSWVSSSWVSCGLSERRRCTRICRARLTEAPTSIWHDVCHIHWRATRRCVLAVQGWANCFSAASRRLSDSAGSSTARANGKVPTMVATVTSARSWVPGFPQSGDWRATRSIISLICRVVTRRTSGAWRGVSEPCTERIKFVEDNKDRRMAVSAWQERARSAVLRLCIAADLRLSNQAEPLARGLPRGASD